MKKDYDSTRIYRNTQKKGASQTYDTPSSFYINDMLSEEIVYVVRKYNISF